MNANSSDPPTFQPGDKVTYWTRRVGEPSRLVVAEVIRELPNGMVKVIRPDAHTPVRQVEVERLRRLT